MAFPVRGYGTDERWTNALSANLLHQSADHTRRAMYRLGDEVSKMNNKILAVGVLVGSTMGFTWLPANADPVNDWNDNAVRILVADSGNPALGTHRLAMVQSAVYLAVNAITQRYPDDKRQIEASPDASIDAAVARAASDMLMEMVPKQQSEIDSAYQSALQTVPEGNAKEQGIATGSAAVETVIDWRTSLGAAKPEDYRPRTSPGVYVPTPPLAGFGWGNRATWNLDSSSQLRPPEPPELTSGIWARDYNEVMQLGAKEGSSRTSDQTEAALFWQATLPSIFQPVIQSLTRSPGRDIADNARLLAVVAQATDDAIVSVFEAKYEYNFWRPETAIRNGDKDDNDETERVSNWEPLIPTPMHPEYPCAHCVVSGTIAAVLNAELEGNPSPELSTQSPALPGVTRSWKSPDAFAQEVADARIYDGVHYRNSVEVGTALGAQVAQIAIQRAFMR